MKPAVRIHAVLGSGRSLEATTRPRHPGIRLPGGLTATRWLSQGASASVGWPLSVEAALNHGDSWAGHCVLNLSQPQIGLEVLTDELDPRYQAGLPWILAVLGDVSAQLSSLGARAVPGWVLLDLDVPADAQRIRKIQSWCLRQGLEIAVVGEVAGSAPANVPIHPFRPLSVVSDLAGFLSAPIRD
jgi:hypothetical protein